jgi:DNA-binding transcriptional LysR family regulator
MAETYAMTDGPARASGRADLVPSVVARAPVIVPMQARLARRFAAELGLSLSPLPLPVDLGGITISLLWHASYDHDPAHAWLREQVAQLAAEL